MSQKFRFKHHGVQVYTQDDDEHQILEEFEEGHPQPGATREDARRRKLIASLPVGEFDIQRDGVFWRIWGIAQESTGAMGPGSALAVALKNASHDAASVRDATEDRRVAADASQPMPRRLAALARINARARHDLR
jgi:hypothetical protein